MHLLHPGQVGRAQAAGFSQAGPVRDDGSRVVAYAEPQVQRVVRWTADAADPTRECGPDPGTKAIRPYNGRSHIARRTVSAIRPGSACRRGAARRPSLACGSRGAPSRAVHFRKSGTSSSSSSSNTTDLRLVPLESTGRPADLEGPSLLVPEITPGALALGAGTESMRAPSWPPAPAAPAAAASPVAQPEAPAPAVAGARPAAPKSPLLSLPFPLATSAPAVDPPGWPPGPWPTALAAALPSPSWNRRHSDGPCGSATGIALGYEAVRGLPRPACGSSKPAAMTGTRTSSPRASSITAPKMMVPSVAAELATSCAGSLIS